MILPVAESCSRKHAGTSRFGYSRSIYASAIFLLILSLIATGPAASGAEPDGRYAILMVGATGDPDLQQRYLEELQKLHSILVGPLGFPPDQVVVLFDNPEMDPNLIRNKSTLRGLEEVCLDLSQRVRESDLVFVFIDGHGSYDGKTYKYCLHGNPDATAWELAEILYSIPAGRFVVVNASSSSGGSLQALSGDDRIVITATKSGMERNLTHMGGYFVEALEENAADSDKNDRVSVLEEILTRMRTKFRRNTPCWMIMETAGGKAIRIPKPGKDFLPVRHFLTGCPAGRLWKPLQKSNRKLCLRSGNWKIRSRS